MDAAGSKLVAALSRPGGHVVVTAPRAGAAAELLSRVDARLAPSRRIRLDGRTLDRADLAREFAAADASAGAVRAAVRARVEEARHDGRPLVVVVHDADAASPAALEHLRLTLECTHDVPDLPRLVLLGGPALAETLGRSEARALASRVTTRVIMSSRTGPAPTAAARDTAGRVPATARPPRRVGRLAVAGLLGAAATTSMLLLTVGLPGGARSRPTPERPRVTHGNAPARVVPAIAAATPPDAGGPAESVAAPVATPPATAVPVAPAAPPAAPEASRRPARPGVVALQVGAFREVANATALRAELARRFAHVSVTPVQRDGATLHRVRVEGLATDAALRTAMADLRRAGFRPFRTFE